MMLTQSEADELIAMEKTFVDPVTISLPPGTDQTHELAGSDPREEFLLDLWRGTLRLSKLRCQTRGRKIIVLVRLDIDGAPHTNPDGYRIGGTHIHLYREGFDDRWAHPLDPEQFLNPADLDCACRDYLRYCNIQNAPLYQGNLL